MPTPFRDSPSESVSGESHTGAGTSAVALPVVCFPPQLNFARSEVRTHRLPLTIYNISDFVVNYRILSTMPENYIVSEPNGQIRSHGRKDITIRNRRPDDVGRQDKLRVEMWVQELRGSTDVILRTLENPMEEEPPRAMHVVTQQTGAQSSSSMASASRGPAASIASSFPRPQPSGPENNDSYIFWSCALVVVCIAALSMPLDQPNSTEQSNFPDWLRVTVPQKLAAAYILGILTVLFIRR